MSMAAQQLGVAEDELPFYRERTLALLRRYFVMALETGRLPSVLGREFFRARVTSYRVHTFEDAVIFVHDMERCLARVQQVGREVIARVVLQGFTEEEAAAQLGISRRHLVRIFPEALDELSAILLKVGMLNAMTDARAPRKTAGSQACQGSARVEIRASA